MEETTKASILLVDDQPENLAALEAVLVKLGQNLVKANLGRQALRYLIDQDFAVILLDVQMPGLDGFETAKLIRQRRRSIDTPIIFLTAKYIEDTDSSVGYALGAVDYLVKPFQPKILQSKVAVFVELFKKTEEIRRQAQLINEIQQKEFESRLMALEASNRLKSEFLANMSHEIRTPMAAVIGIAELLTHTPLNAEQKEFARIIRDSSQTLMTIINDVLDLSKIEAGKLDLESSDFDLSAIVEEVALLLADTAHTKRVSLMSFVDPTLPSVLSGDPTRVRQVLLNLVSNALKFTERGEVVVRALTDPGALTDTSHTTVRFEVTDTGIGITQAKIDEIFQPFTQADNSTTRKYGGTGLGLSISKRLVELMGGKIGVESAENQGSTFWFTLPLTVTSRDRREEEDILLPQAKVLVIDDQQSCLKILSSYLSSWGMHCDAVTTGEEALALMRREALAGQPYQLAIVDLIMPGMDGFTVAENIRAEKALNECKLILLTGYDNQGQGERAVQAGFSAYLIKPVKQRRLIDCISKVMNLPAKESATRSNTPYSLDAASAATAAEVEPMILLAEDNEVNKHVTLLQLRQLGYDAHAVTNGREAVERALSGHYNLVLMDCNMPELDGFAAASTIRKEEALTGQHITIIGLTALAMTGDRERCLAAGMDHYLTKPVTLDELRNTIRGWLKEGDSAPTHDLQAAPSEKQLVEESREFKQFTENFGQEAVRELFPIFISETEELLKKLDQAIPQQDLAAVGAIVHELKGACATMGAMNMARTALQIEQCLHDSEPDWQQIQRSYLELDGILQRFRKYLVVSAE